VTASSAKNCGTPIVGRRSDEMSRAVAALQALPRCSVTGCVRRIIKSSDRSKRNNLFEIVVGEADWHALTQAEKDLLQKTYDLSLQARQYAWYQSSEASQTACPNGCKVCEFHGVSPSDFSMKLRFILGDVTIRHMQATCPACSAPWVVEVATDATDSNVVDIGDVSWQYSAEIADHDWKRMWVPLVVVKKGQREQYALNGNVRGRHVMVPSIAKQSFGRELWSLTGHQDFISRTAFSPDGKALASASSDGTVRLWNMATGDSARNPLPGEDDIATGLSFSPDGQYLMVTWLNRLVVWSISNGKKSVDRQIYSNRRWHSAATDRAWKLLALAWGDEVSLTDMASGRSLFTFRGHESEIVAVAISPDGRLLASGDVGGRVIVWNSRERRLVHDLSEHREMVYGLAFDHTGQFLASASNDQSTNIWDTNSGHVNAHLHGHVNNVHDVIFSHDRTTLLTAGDDGCICVWPLKPQVANSELVVSSMPIPPSSPVTRLNSLFVAGKILQHGDYKSGLSIDHTGSRIAYAAEDRRIKIWSVRGDPS
jgi:WD40 repeat protein